ncbi:hypothetical protein GO986_10830 [Deinococcus sp. HMF7620]|uniref:Uncharacterized protein n=1 Tax=Deinococcus arboris TaxID=2682977 RepID=A0A7C9M6L9_9DEIO|nr:hypothetical protein [Deinococcus arboris]MVN87265.1 hypothetical protein [Deinococcus arboris]
MRDRNLIKSLEIAARPQDSQEDPHGKGSSKSTVSALFPRMPNFAKTHFSNALGQCGLKWFVGNSRVQFKSGVTSAPDTGGTLTA